MMEMAIIILIGTLFIYLIVKRIIDKKKENFEDREY
jgi:hypothetical protein